MAPTDNLESLNAMFNDMCAHVCGTPKPGLLDVPGWESMPPTVAAQAVQRSAFPDAYARWETSARVWLTEVLDDRAREVDVFGAV